MLWLKLVKVWSLESSCAGTRELLNVWRKGELIPARKLVEEAHCGREGVCGRVT